MNIRQKIVLSLVCVALPSLLAVGAFSYWQASVVVEQAQRLSLDALAASRRAQLLNQVRDWNENTEQIAAERLLVGTLQDFNRKPYTRFKRRLARIMARWTSSEGVVWAQLMDRDKKTVAQSGQHLLSEREDTYDYARGGFQILYIDNVESSDVPIALVQHPVLVNNDVIGYLTVERRVRGLVDLVRDEHGLGNTGQISVLWNGDNPMILTHTRDADVSQNIIPVAKTNTATTRLSLGAGDVFVATRVINSARLAIAVTLDAEEVLQPVEELGLAIAGFCAAVVAFVLVAGLWIGGYLTKGVRHLSDIAVRIGNGQLNLRATVTGQDEVAALSRSFNAMTEALVTANETLETRVADRTRELAESHAKLESRNTELSRSNRDLMEFASVASHDLQEPLRKVQAFGDRLSDKYLDQLDERGQDYIRRMQHSAMRMRKLIEDLLTFSRVQSKAQPFAKVNLNKILQTTISDFELRLDESDGRIECAELPVIDADPSQMQQLFQNLIGNAIKYARQGIPPHIQVSSQCDAEQVHITVKDNGIGFEAHHAERIFGIFQRLHGRDAYEGTGVGLAICQRIVERHVGEISCTSEVDTGSTFKVSLPCEQVSPDDNDATSSTGAPL